MTQRRLAAILAADVVGYSRLVSADEADALTRLSMLRREIIEPGITKHSGRLFKIMGDGFLAEFASAVQAVNCAIAIQAEVEQAASAFDDARKMRLRIGIHVGDVMVEGDDLMGDGVNIAARLESIAAPGGLSISRAVHDQVRDRIDVAFDDKDEIALKNIARPVQVFALAGSKSMTAKQASVPAPALALPDKPSIAVLPFQNMSGDPEQEYFADGMVEDIITALSRFKSLFVIARNSSFTYKGKAVDIKQVGRELGVRYVLEGSVRKAGSRVRITGQLIEAATGSHIWADKFDGGLEDVFGLQDQVTTSVVGLIAPKLVQAEIERALQKPTDRLDGYDFYLRGMASLYRGAVPEAYELFKKAIGQDPEYAAAYAVAASALMRQQADSGVTLTDEMRTEALRFAELGSRLANEDALALARCGHVVTYLGHEYDRGASLVEQAVALNPNLAMAWHSRGWVSLMCAQPERAIESFDRMIRLSPLDPLRMGAWTGTSFALFHLGRYDDGAAVAVKSIQYRTDAQTLGAYIMNSVRAGRVAEAREAAARLLKLQPDFRVSHVKEAFPIRSLDERERIAAALRDAGLPH
ncbi:adenylate/guanylate cyclase domain-containing protein [Bradyrhizobium sp. Ash2021]|uniref:adenylate/guanylate cyclase domain-containing protein n=1 Tax=Bradyrhizobium sp. Ash2021 TaxID=2954771 RepID=UPI0028153375|nr:adenylate/guanylate cyclase domain-containing protein [Bradyrhizobium sp. Ash2021]WMT73334.1 adenylate/guanylate cyclase domain-containing protein [Bradyrhizobium sp. Ash2021]